MESFAKTQPPILVGVLLRYALGHHVSFGYGVGLVTQTTNKVKCTESLSLITASALPVTLTLTMFYTMEFLHEEKGSPLHAKIGGLTHRRPPRPTSEGHEYIKLSGSPR